VTLATELVVISMPGLGSHIAQRGSNKTLCGQARTNVRRGTTEVTCSICNRSITDIVDTLDQRNVDRFKVRRAWEIRESKGIIQSLLRGERGVAPSTDRRAHLRRSSSLSTLRIIGLAIAVLFAIFGVISIAQFLQRISGG